MKSILDPSFRYTKSVETDLRKTFARVRRNLRKQQQEQSTVGVDVIRKVLPFRSAVGRVGRGIARSASIRRSNTSSAYPPCSGSSSADHARRRAVSCLRSSSASRVHAGARSHLHPGENDCPKAMPPTQAPVGPVASTRDHLIR